jgi:hypothetical protein
MEFRDLLSQVKNSDPTLTELILDSRVLGYSLTASQVEQLRDALAKNVSLKKIVIVGTDLICDLEKNAAAELLDTLLTQIFNYVRRSKTLEALTLSHCGLDEVNLIKMALPLEKSTTLKCLALHDEVLTVTRMEILLQALMAQTSLQVLSLDGSRLNYQAGKMLGDYLVQNKTLVALSLRDNELDLVNIRALVEVLRKNQSLRTLQLESRQNQENLARSLALFSSILSDNMQLQVLGLGVMADDIQSKSVVQAIQTQLTVNKMIATVLNNHQSSYDVCREMFLSQPSSCSSYVFAAQIDAIKEYLNRLNRSLGELDVQYEQPAQKKACQHKVDYAVKRLAKEFLALYNSSARAHIRTIELIAIMTTLIKANEELLAPILKMLEQHCRSIAKRSHEPEVLASQLFIVVSMAISRGARKYPILMQTQFITHVQQFTSLMSPREQTDNQRGMLALVADLNRLTSARPAIRSDSDDLRRIFTALLNQIPIAILRKAQALFLQETDERRSPRAVVELSDARPRMAHFQFFATKGHPVIDTSKQLLTQLKVLSQQGVIFSCQNTFSAPYFEVTLMVQHVNTKMTEKMVKEQENLQELIHQQKLGVLLNFIPLLSNGFESKEIKTEAGQLVVITRDFYEMRALVKALFDSGCMKEPADFARYQSGLQGLGPN